MKSNIFIKALTISAIFLLSIIGCKKDGTTTTPPTPTPTLVIPTLTTTSAGSISQTNAQSGGSVSADGGASVSSRGVCWSASLNPTIADTHTSDGTGTGVFTSSLTGLSANTAYHIRAYATNSVGTAYGNDVTFSTLAIPTLAILAATTVASAITGTTAQSGGSVTSDGNATVTARGVCWATTANPTIANSKTTDGTGTGVFTSSLTGLTGNTTYHIRAYAINSVGTAYGTDITFTTLPPPVPPTLTTVAYSFTAVNTVKSGGANIVDGYAPITAKGVCYGASTNPTITDARTSDGTGTANFVSTLSSLNPGTYYARAYATNIAGTGYGNQITFIVYAIGQSYGGGRIFYIDGTFQHGLITCTSALTDNGGVNTSIDWDNGSNTLTSANATTIGTGLANTNTIISVLGASANSAAKICKNYNGGGYTDWYLPSKDELNQLYITKDIVGTFGGFTTYSYWSSSESSSTKAWSQSFQSGTQSAIIKSGFGAPWIRAIRNF